MNTFKIAVLLSMLILSLSSFSADEENQTVTQKIFLICPHISKESTEILYVILDKNDPSQLKGIGVEEMNGINSIDYKYDSIQKMQNDNSVTKTKVAELMKEEFSSQKLAFNDNLKINIITLGNEKYNININSRVSPDKHFLVGGKESGNRDITLEYNTTCKLWQLKSIQFIDSKGVNIARNASKIFTGIRFNAAPTVMIKMILIDSLNEAYLIYEK